MLEPHPRAELRHAVPGRMRVHLPSARGCPDHLEQVCRRLREVEGVERVQANPDTGSLLVLGPIDIESLAGAALARGLFDLERSAAIRPLVDDLADRFNDLDRAIRGVSGGRLDLAGLVVLGTAGWAVVQAVRGEVGVPAVTLLWYAASAVLMARGIARGPG